MKLNGLLPGVPPGTLAANLVGAFVIGVALAWIATSPGVSPEWRLLITTGFCGGLTTFSTFSAEVFALLQQGRIGWAAGAIGVHVGGSLLMTLVRLRRRGSGCAGRQPRDRASPEPVNPAASGAIIRRRLRSGIAPADQPGDSCRLG
jgi:CrcB protein